jgi:hypothetical protein
VFRAASHPAAAPKAPPTNSSVPARIGSRFSFEAAPCGLADDRALQ